MGTSPDRVKPKTIKMESGQYVRVGQHVYTWTVVSVTKHCKNPTKRVGLVQSGPDHHLIEN